MKPLSTCLALALCVALFPACAPKDARTPQSESQSQNETSQQGLSQNGSNASSPAKLPKSVESALLPESGEKEKDLERERSRSREPRFDVRANQVPARQFFMSLVSDTPHSLTVHPDVEGTITLQMHNATLKQVLEAVRNLYGYPYRRSGGGYQILPAGTISRTFHVDYLDLTRKGGSQTQVRSGSVTQNQDGGGNDGSVTSTQISTESESAFWSELKSTLTSIVGQGEDRRIITQPQAGLVVVRATPRELEQVQQYLQTMQQSIQRQVILEAKIMEVRLSQGHQRGINWSAVLSGAQSRGVISQTGGGNLLSDGAATTAGNTVMSPGSADQLDAGRGVEAFGGIFSAAINIDNFTTFIELLDQQGDVNVLSSPRVSAMNNQKAVIKVGTDEFFVTDISTETDTIGATDERQISDVTLDPFFSGIALDVTPYISQQDLVTMHIHPSVSNVSEVTKNLRLGEGSSLALPLAQSDIRESDTIVKARDGQVVVIGGLMKTRTTDEQASVPVLGDLPLLGYLFSHEKQVKEKSELVIMIRPKVIGYGQNPGQEASPLDPGAEGYGRQWRGQ